MGMREIGSGRGRGWVGSKLRRWADVNGFGLGHDWDKSSDDAWNVTTEPQTYVIDPHSSIVMTPEIHSIVRTFAHELMPRE